MRVILDRMVGELSDEISTWRNVNAIISRHSSNIRRWDRAYRDLEESEGMDTREYLRQTSDRHELGSGTK